MICAISGIPVATFLLFPQVSEIFSHWKSVSSEFYGCLRKAHLVSIVYFPCQTASCVSRTQANLGLVEGCPTSCKTSIDGVFSTIGKTTFSLRFRPRENRTLVDPIYMRDFALTIWV